MVYCFSKWLYGVEVITSDFEHIQFSGNPGSSPGTTSNFFWFFGGIMTEHVST